MNASLSLEKSPVLLGLEDLKAESTCLGMESGKTASLAVELRWLHEVTRSLGMGYKSVMRTAENFLLYPRVA